MIKARKIIATQPPVQKTWPFRAARLAVLLISVYALAVAINVIYALSYPAERALPQNARIVVLSHYTGFTSKQRIDIGLGIFGQSGASEFVVTGDKIAPVMAERAEEGGIPSNIIILEGKARSTLQNALFTRDVIADPAMPTLLITERFHLLRSYWSFRWAGFGNVIMVPSDQAADYVSLSAARVFAVEAAKWGYNLARVSIASVPGFPKSAQSWFLR